MANAVQVLDRARLARVAPSVFATSPWGERSERYKFIPTIEVIDQIADSGFLPVWAAQSRTRIPGKGDFTKHMVRFRSESSLNPINVGDEIAELVLVNSHDGTSAYKFLAGVFRLVCSNGMIVCSEDMGNVSVRHQGGNDFHKDVIDATFQVMDNAGRAIDTANDWKQIELSQPEREAFATAALELKPNANVTTSQLLSPRRDADRRNDLWTTTNVIQEHMMKGGDSGRSTSGRRTRTRAVKSVSEDVRLNRALWVLAESLAASRNG